MLEAKKYLWCLIEVLCLWFSTGPAAAFMRIVQLRGPEKSAQEKFSALKMLAAHCPKVASQTTLGGEQRGY